MGWDNAWGPRVLVVCWCIVEWGIGMGVGDICMGGSW